MYQYFVLLIFFGGSFCSADCSLPVGSIPPYTTAFYTQYVDHFNLYTTPATFQQRYLYWLDCWDKPTGPIFFYSGNEDDITDFWNNTGLIFELAYTFKGAVIFAEHRYYGESLPFGIDKSLTPPYIGLQNIEQALADFAVMIPDLLKLFGATQPVVFTLGGSYGGMLSAWFRMKYPNIVDAALAASAPIITFAGIPDSPTFFETVTNDYSSVNPRCPDLVRSAFTELINTAKTPAGLAAITSRMRLCKPLSADDIEHLILWAANGFGSLGMSDYPYPTDFGIVLPGWPINLSCQLLLNNTQDLLYALSQAVGVYYNGTGGSLGCFDIYSEFVFCADQTGCGLGPIAQAWDYQACTELMFFPNTNGVTDMFPPRNWTFNDLTQYCLKTWQVQPRQTWGRTVFSAYEYQSASRIIFSNGLLDPWHGGGVLTNYSTSLPSLIVTDGAHHLDIRASNPLDPYSVIWVRASEANYFRTWLTEIREEKYGVKEEVSLRESDLPWFKVLLSFIKEKSNLHEIITE